MGFNLSCEGSREEMRGGPEWARQSREVAGHKAWPALRAQFSTGDARAPMSTHASTIHMAGDVRCRYSRLHVCTSTVERPVIIEHVRALVTSWCVRCS